MRSSTISPREKRRRGTRSMLNLRDCFSISSLDQSGAVGTPVLESDAEPGGRK